MIELVEGLPDGVVGLEAVGEVTGEDYAEAAHALEGALGGRSKIRLLHVLGDRFTKFTTGGVWKDAELGLRHAFSFERVAVVSDVDAVRKLVRTAGWAVPGEMRLFSTAHRAEAVAWIQEDLQS